MNIKSLSTEELKNLNEKLQAELLDRGEKERRTRRKKIIYKNRIILNHKNALIDILEHNHDLEYEDCRIKNGIICCSKCFFQHYSNNFLAENFHIDLSVQVRDYFD